MNKNTVATITHFDKFLHNSRRYERWMKHLTQYGSEFPPWMIFLSFWNTSSLVEINFANRTCLYTQTSHVYSWVSEERRILARLRNCKSWLKRKVELQVAKYVTSYTRRQWKHRLRNRIKRVERFVNSVYHSGTKIHESYSALEERDRSNSSESLSMFDTLFEFPVPPSTNIPARRSYHEKAKKFPIDDFPLPRNDPRRTHRSRGIVKKRNTYLSRCARSALS